MKKFQRFVGALCASCLAMGLTASALAAGFADVPAESWFEQGVTTCAEQGVMVGTGEDVFSPAGTLTNAECLTLALRLYDLQRGGDGTLETAPEDWLQILWTLADGTVLQGDRNDGPFTFSSFRRDGNADAHLSLTLTEEQEEWGKNLDGKETAVALNGQVYAGTARCWEPAGDGVWVLSFYPDSQDGGAAIRRAMQEATSPAPGVWYRDAIYTGQAWGLDGETTPGLAALLENASDSACFRGQFARALADAAGELEKKYEVESIPDLERTGNEAIFSLYEAGILNGMDDYGTFQPYKSLTRAEAAVMVARVLDENQRFTSSDAPGALSKNVEETTWDKDKVASAEPFKPSFDSLDISDIAYVNLTYGGYPPYQLPDGDVEQLVAYLKQIEIGEPEQNYMDYDGMVSQMFVLHLKDGEAIRISGSNPFLIVNGAGYHCDYETCHKIALIYRSHLAEIRENSTPSVTQ